MNKENNQTESIDKDTIKNKATAITTNNDTTINLFIDEDLADALDADDGEELTSTTTTKLLNLAKLSKLNNTELIYSERGHTVYAKLTANEKGEQIIQFYFLFADNSITDSIQVKQSSLFKMAKHLFCEGNKTPSNKQNKSEFQKFWDRVLDIRRGMAVMNPHQIVINTITKLGSLPQEVCLSDNEKERTFINEFYDNVDNVLNSHLQGKLFKGKENSLYYKLPTKIFEEIAIRMKKTRYNLATELYRLGLLYTYGRPDTGYQTRATFVMSSLSNEVCEEFGIETNKDWKPEVYSVLKPDAYKKSISISSDAKIEYVETNEDKQFLENTKNMLLLEDNNNNKLL